MSINSSGNSVPPHNYLDQSAGLKENKTENSKTDTNSQVTASEVFNKSKNALSDQSVDKASAGSASRQTLKGESISLGDRQPQSSGVVKKADTVGQNLLVQDKLPSPFEVKAKSNQSSPAQGMERMVNLLRLNVIPDIPNEPIYGHEPSEIKALYKICNTEKKEFLAEHITFENASLILKQAEESPLLHSAVAALRDNLDLWEDLSLRGNSQGLVELKSELQEQMKNLVVLSKKLEEFSSFLKLAEAPPEAAGLNELKEKRGKSFVTTDAILQQASLHQAMREGKGWAMQQPNLNKLGTSANDVFRLNSALTHDPVAYFKVGKLNEAAAGTMEKLMWDIAVVLGKENQFVATGETEVRDQTQQIGGYYRAKQWDEKVDLKNLQSAAEPRKGGIQVAQKGQTLNEMNKAGKQVAREEVVDATLTGLVFGMFDAHSANIFVTEEGKIKFFDNTRSMPNSNEFINRGYGIVSSYRSSLLDLDVAKKPLTTEEIGELKNKVKDYQQKMEGLKKYLNSREVRNRLYKLPPGWMNLASSLAAMDQRLSLMEAALNAGQVKTLEDLAAESNPSYKFAYALAQLDVLYRTNGMDISGKNVHTYVGYTSVEEGVRHANVIGIDLELVQKWCKDPTMSTSNLTNKLGYHYIYTTAIPPTNEKLLEISFKNGQVLQKIGSNAEHDYKDISRKESMDYVDNHNLNNLCLMGMGAVPYEYAQTVESAIQYAKFSNRHLVIFGNHGDFKVLQQTPIGFQVKSIDSSFKLGVVREKFLDPGGDVYYGSEMKIADFYNAYAYPQPTNFEELPVINPMDRDILAMERGLLVSKSPEGYLLVTMRLQNDSGYFVVSNAFAESDMGGFIVHPNPWLGIHEDTNFSVDQLAYLYGSKVDSKV